MSKAKQPVKASVDATPQVLITREQYIADLKVRWEIHTYEVNKLAEDVKKGIEFASPYIQRAVDFISTKYQELQQKRIAA